MGRWLRGRCASVLGVVVVSLVVVACSGPARVSIAVVPTEVTLAAGASQVFVVSVAGTSDTSVSWAVTGGTLVGAGGSVTFTAPSTAGVVELSAASNAAVGVRAVARITVVVPVVGVTLEPASVALPVGGTQSLTATVTGSVDTSVTWSATCGGVAGGGNTVTYSAPGVAGSCTVTATSSADPSKSASASVTVTAAGGFDLAPSYISISNVSLAVSSGGARRVGFDIGWDESWRGPDRPSWVAASDNWDAAWVFVKYRVSGGPWQHATLASGGHVQPSGSVVSVPRDRRGAFVYRSVSGYGSFAAKGVGLQWDYVADGVLAGASVEVVPFAIEMVYVPQGSFSVGSGGTSTGEFRAGGTSSTPFVVGS